MSQKPNHPSHADKERYMLEEMIWQKHITLNDVQDYDPGYSYSRWMLNPPLPKNRMNAQNILDVFLGKRD